jgi:F0F1-type ATP synthase assembly protein I
VEDFRWLSLAIQMGWLFVFAILIPLGAGLWLDKTLGTLPIFTLAGMLLGFIAGTVGVYRVATTSLAEVEEKTEDKEDEQ